MFLQFRGTLGGLSKRPGRDIQLTNVEERFHRVRCFIWAENAFLPLSSDGICQRLACEVLVFLPVGIGFNRQRWDTKATRRVAQSLYPWLVAQFFGGVPIINGVCNETGTIPRHADRNIPHIVATTLHFAVAERESLNP